MDMEKIIIVKWQIYIKGKVVKSEDVNFEMCENQAYQYRKEIAKENKCSEKEVFFVFKSITNEKDIQKN